MKNKLYVTRKTVTTAGTREPLAGDHNVVAVLIQAEVTNSGTVYVGDDTVSSTKGFELNPGDSLRLNAGDLLKNPGDTISLGDIWLDVGTSGDGVMYGYLEAQ